MLLHHDTEYKENDADFEACFPVRKRREVAGAEVRELPGARCVTLVHQGPYEELGRSYAKVLSYVKSRGYDVEMPTREGSSGEPVTLMSPDSAWISRS